MTNFGGGPPPLHDFPPLGRGTPPEQAGHNRTASGPAKRHFSGDWRTKPTPAMHQRDRAITGTTGADGTASAKSPPKSQYDRPLVIPTPGSYKYSYSDTSHVPCRFFPLGQCQAGATCPFKHTMDRMDAQCKYFLKGNCKFGNKCALLHVLPNGKQLNSPNNNLSIGSRINPMAHQNQGQNSVLGNSLSTGIYTEPVFNHQIPIFQTQPYDIPQSPQIDQQYAKSPPIGLTALDVPMPASFDSQGVSYMARHGPVAASMPGALLGPQSPPASLPKPIAAKPSYRNNDQHDFGSSPDMFLDASSTRPMHSQRVPNNRRMAASLPRHGYDFDPSWEQGEETIFGGEDLLPSDLSNLMTPAERSRRLSGKLENLTGVRSSLNGHSTPNELSSMKVGSPPFGQSPSRFSQYFKEQAETGSPEFQPLGSPLSGPAMHPGLSPALAARQNIDSLSLSSSPWANTAVSNLSVALQRTRLNDNQTTRPVYNRVASNPRTAFERVASGNSVSNTIEEDIPEGVFSLEGLEEEEGGTSKPSSSTTNKPPANIWGNAGLQQQRRIVPAVPFFEKKPVTTKPAGE